MPIPILTPIVVGIELSACDVVCLITFGAGVAYKFVRLSGVHCCHALVAMVGFTY